jgi:hypothetical protein
MNDILRLRQLAGLNEAELNRGLPAEALTELDACLREAVPVITAALDICQDLARFGKLAPEQQHRIDNAVDVLGRLRRLDAIPVAARADLLDDTLTAITGIQYIFIPLQQVFVLPENYIQMLAKRTASQRRCYACLKIVGVGWGDT